MDQKHKITEKDLPQKFMVKLLGRRPAKGLWGIKNTREAVDELVSSAKTQNLSLPVVQLEVNPLGVRVAHLPKPLFVRKPEEESDFSLDENDNEIKKCQTKPKSLLKFPLFPGKSKAKKIKGEVNDKENINPNLKIDFDRLKQIKEEHKLRADQSFFGIDSISYGVQDLVFTRVFSMIVVSEEERSHFHCYSFICEDRFVARNLTYSLSAAFQVYSRSLKESQPASTHNLMKVCKPKILSIDLQPHGDRQSLLNNYDSEA